MTAEKSQCGSIPVRNIYHMLCYAWNAQYLMDDCPVGDDGEFDDVCDMLSYLVAREALRIAERGLIRQYHSCYEQLQSPRGRIDMAGSFSLSARNKLELLCENSEYNVNNDFNGIIAFSLHDINSRHASSSNEAQSGRHAKTRRLLNAALPHFQNVDPVRPEGKRVERLSFHALNSHYRFVISLCSYLHEHRLPLHGEDGGFMGEASWSSFAGIFERFVREFYRVKLPQLYGPEIEVDAGHRIIHWQVEENDDSCRLMPRMEADVWIERKMPHGLSQVIIMDAKCYKRALRGNKVRPPHLYQLCSYMANARTRNGKPFDRTSGCLIYPLTGDLLREDISLLAGRLHLRTVDLSLPWQDVEQQMLNIAESVLSG